MPYQAIDISSMTREEWLDARRPYIGGSDAASIAGLNRYCSPYKTALLKMGAIPEDDLTGNESVEWGVILEPVVREQAVSRIAASLGVADASVTIAKPTEMHVSEQYPWASVNLDGLVYVDGELVAGFEAKAVDKARLDEFTEDADPAKATAPADYIVQCIHALAVRDDLPCMFLAALIGGNRYRLVRIDRDDVAVANLMKIESDFRDMLERGELPVPTASDGDRDALLYLSPEPDEAEVELGDDAADAMREYVDAQAKEKEASERRKAAANRLRALAGDAKRVTAGGYKATRVHSIVPPHEVKESVRDYYTIKEG
jgi:predicted phage-related endonuclease